MKTFTLVSALVALTLPGLAQAKEISSVTVCGADGCETIEDPNPSIAGGGPPGMNVPPPSGYYSATIAVKDDLGERHDPWTVYYVPESNMIAFKGEFGQTEWAKLTRDPEEAFRNATAGREPYPAPRIVGALVDGKPAADPSSYALLLDVRSAGDALPSEPDWLRVKLQADRTNPWTSTPLEYSPSTNVLLRGRYEYVLLPDATAKAIESGASLEAGVGSGFDWPLVSSSIVGALALALGAALLVRRSRRSTPAPA